MANLPEIPNTKGAAWVLRGGAGNKPQFIIGQDARGRVGATSGGGVGVESLFSFGEPVGTRITSNQERVTGQLATTTGMKSALRDLGMKPKCIPTLIVANGCTPQDASKFASMRIYVDAVSTGLSESNDILDGITGEDADQLDQFDFSALARIEVRQLAHSIQSGTVTTAAINKIILLNQQNCNNCGDLEFIAVGDAISPATIPRIYYGRRPAGSDVLDNITWTQQTIAAVANGAAESVAVAGNRVIVAVSGTNGGVFTALLDDVKTGTATFTLANGITAAHVYNDVVALDGMTVLAVGASGRIALSTDGGFSFTLLASPVSSALNRAACGGDKNIAWIGGASGVVIRLKNTSTAELLTVTPIGTDGVTALAVPRNRLGEVFIGTDAGEIVKSRNARDAVPVWEQLEVPAPSTIIEDIQFTDVRGQIMFVLQTNATSATRALVDYTGGSGGSWLMPVGTFASPANSVINSIAPVDANLAYTVGEVDNSQGFIGKVAG